MVEPKKLTIIAIILGAIGLFISLHFLKAPINIFIIMMIIFIEVYIILTIWSWSEVRERLYVVGLFIAVSTFLYSAYTDVKSGDIIINEITQMKQESNYDLNVTYTCLPNDENNMYIREIYRVFANMIYDPNISITLQIPDKFDFNYSLSDNGKNGEPISWPENMAVEGIWGAKPGASLNLTVFYERKYLNALEKNNRTFYISGKMTNKSVNCYGNYNQMVIFRDWAYQ